MQLVINEPLVKRESRIGAILLGVTFALLAAAMFLSLQQDRWRDAQDSWVPVVATYAVMIVGMALYYFGNARLRRFGPRNRQDARLQQLLKGLDDRYALYSFLGKGLPDYLLVGPTGVHVLVARPQSGEIVCRADRWQVAGGAGRRLFTALYGNPIGTPSHEASRGVARVRELLGREDAGSSDAIPVAGLVVFTGDQVRLRVERCSFPATTGKELRKVVTRSRTRLPTAELQRVHQTIKTQILI